MNAKQKKTFIHIINLASMRFHFCRMVLSSIPFFILALESVFTVQSKKDDNH